LVEVQRLAEANGEGAAARDVESATGQRLVGAADRRRHDGHPRPQGDHGDSRLPRYQPPLAAERPFGEDPDDAALLEGAEGTLDGAWIGPLEIDRDGAQPPVKQDAAGRGKRAADEEGWPGHRDAQHHLRYVVIAARMNAPSAGSDGAL
jgi:hypothetical protein